MNGLKYCLAPLVLIAILMAAGSAQAQVFDEKYSHWPEDLKINGRIVIDNDLRDFDQLSTVLERVADGRTVCCLHAGKEPADTAMLRQLKAAAGENGKVASHASRRRNSPRRSAPPTWFTFSLPRNITKPCLNFARHSPSSLNARACW